MAASEGESEDPPLADKSLIRDGRFGGFELLIDYRELLRIQPDTRLGGLFNAGCHGYGLGLQCIQNRAGRNAPYTVFLQQFGYRAWADTVGHRGRGYTLPEGQDPSLIDTALEPEKLGEVAPELLADAVAQAGTLYPYGKLVRWPDQVLRGRDFRTFFG